jgi:protection-of-telomeres protein 1
MRNHVVKSEQDHQHIVPFSVGRYRANVRVVDFFPRKLEEFAVGRRITEYDMLSDYSGGEESDRDEDLGPFQVTRKKWEWRFALNVEDASANFADSKVETWLMVDNEAAQMLLNLDATK